LAATRAHRALATALMVAAAARMGVTEEAVAVRAGKARVEEAS
jgi:hypothetical protein